MQSMLRILVHMTTATTSKQSRLQCTVG